jgi:hypothetical protein
LTPGYYENTGFAMTIHKTKSTEKQDAVGVQVEPIVIILHGDL